MGKNRAIGSEKEALAAKYLEGLGFKIVERNFNSRNSEIDIIAKDGKYLCFVEVKYRENSRLGTALEAVTFEKMGSICRGAMFYMKKNGYGEGTPVRFDVVAIDGEEIKLVKNAFDFAL